jgi:hypothetical protein
MLIFASSGSVDWPLGAVLGVGSVAGGLLGSRLSVSDQARRWIVGLLVTVIIGELIQLSLRYLFDLIGQAPTVTVPRSTLPSRDRHVMHPAAQQPPRTTR